MLPQLSKEDGGDIVKRMLGYGFWLGLAIVLAMFLLQFSGIGLSAWKSYMDKEKVVAMNPKEIAEHLLAMLPTDQRASEKKQWGKALSKTIIALPETNTPAEKINDALRKLGQNNTEPAKAIFAEMLKAKEVEGPKAHKEAAVAARHLGVLSFLNNTEEALAIYRKAVKLDPDNADGWNQLGLLLGRTKKFDEAEQAYHKALSLAETDQDRELQTAALDNLSNISRTQGKKDNDDEIHEKSISIEEQPKNQIPAPKIINMYQTQTVTDHMGSVDSTSTMINIRPYPVKDFINEQ